MISGYTLQDVKNYLKTIENKIETRQKGSPEHYDETLKNREAVYLDAKNLKNSSIDEICDGVYYLDNIDSHYIRTYKIKN